MPVIYQIVRKNPRGEGVTKYYAAITGCIKTGLPEICRRIAAGSTFSQADVMGEVQAFVALMPEYLKEGRSVHLEGLGIFSLRARSVGRNTPGEVKAKDISGLKVVFLAHKRMKQALKGTRFKRLS